MRYDKLVRDKMPERIRAKGEACSFHVADDAEYWQKLKAKMAEEMGEFVRDESADEVADILEVLDAIIAYKKFDRAEIEAIKKRKFDERGGFEGRIILDES
ncbi:phosphoribosyl-ATP pyrophosphohydrolase [Patescibacteria group bacterium]|nr:MAG: phosphoribosyl-ATP pyrophosphohydrolase [Patescibacteria group bacterium]